MYVLEYTANLGWKGSGSHAFEASNSAEARTMAVEFLFARARVGQADLDAPATVYPTLPGGGLDTSRAIPIIK